MPPNAQRVPYGLGTDSKLCCELRCRDIGPFCLFVHFFTPSFPLCDLPSRTAGRLIRAVKQRHTSNLEKQKKRPNQKGIFPFRLGLQASPGVLTGARMATLTTSQFYDEGGLSSAFIEEFKSISCGLQRISGFEPFTWDKKTKLRAHRKRFQQCFTVLSPVKRRMCDHRITKPGTEGSG